MYPKVILKGIFCVLPDNFLRFAWQATRFNFIGMGDFLEELNNSLDSFDWALNSYNEYIADMEAEYRSDMMAENDYY